MGSRRLFHAVVAVVACAAMSAVAQFNAFEDHFDGPSLNGRWGTNAGVTWIDTDGNLAAGCLSIDASGGATSVSPNLYTGRGFTAGAVMVSFYMKDPNGGAGIDIHIDMATSCASCGYWDYRTQTNFVSSAFSTDWELAIDQQWDDLGAIAPQWGTGTYRTILIDALQNDAECGPMDTTGCNVVLIWRVNVSTGVLLIDDWIQSPVTSTRPDTKQRAADGWKLVTMSTRAQFPKATNYTVTILGANGQAIATHQGYGNVAVAPQGLASGSYLMKVTSEFGETTTKLAVPR